MSVRARRPPSPPPRFPHRKEDHLDADERRAAASLGYAPGQKRAHAFGGIKMTGGEWKLLIVLTLVAAAVRLFRISKPNSVVFDEVHFGKFASKYIKTQFFVDVHPPLAKLLITLAAYIMGYDGSFDFKDIAKTYDHVPYVAMRMVPGLMGVATVPIAYMTIRALDCRATTALLAALFVTFENALTTQSRLILLDSPLVFFTALSLLVWTGFCNEDKQQPFTKSWWTWLTLTGLSLGAVLSCKWVGLFTIATVGVSTLRQLWLLLGDLRVTPRLWMRHFMARALCLIAIPTLFYMAMFEIHFLILQNSGDGDGFMSSEFQHTLGGKGMADTYADVALGSVVTLRHVNTQGGYMHSHPHNYPGGSKQQQITLYPHRDHNNEWRIENATALEDGEFNWETDPVRPVTDKMRIKLMHTNTERRLHSHDVRPPVSDVDFQQEVSAYGMRGFAGDMNDDWIVEIDHGSGGDRESSKRLRTLRTQFKLRHALTGCYLFSHKVKLPEWGFEQQEVTCNKNAVRENSLWYIETNEHPMLLADPHAQRVNYRLPGFLSKFIELQEVMWRTNAGLTDRHAYDSRPDSWPRLKRGINFWVKDHRQIYLVGNPLIWTLSTLAVVFYAGIRGLLILREKRGYRDFDNTKVVKYDHLCGFLFVGWCLHYLPFFLMSRQLFLHHYLPALYIAILLSCSVFDLATSTLKPRYRLAVAGVLILFAIAMFQHFSPLTYGTPWTKAECKKAQWVKTWDFSCNDFLEDYAGYKGAVVATPRKSAVPTGGGRGAVPVAVDNKPVANVETSSIIMQAPEPGRDVFAGEPVKDIKSAAKPPGQEQQAQPEASISTSAVPKELEAEAAPKAEEPAQKQDAAEAVGKAAEETVPPKAAEAETSVEVKSEETKTEEAKAKTEEKVEEKVDPPAKAAGPMGEDDAQAARVGAELYDQK